MFEFKLPDLGEGIHEGELIKWYVKEGKTVKEDDPLCDMETDKATVTLPSPRSGLIVSLNAEPGETITVGSVLVVIDEKNETQPVYPKSDSHVPEAPEAPEVTEIPAPSSAQHDDKLSQKAIAAPATRRIAREMGIDINLVKGSGAGGKVTKEDLDAFMTDKSAKDQTESATDISTPKAANRGPETQTSSIHGGIPFFEVSSLPDFESQGPVQKEPVRSLRKKTGIKTTSSAILIPHVAHMDECDVTEFEKFRAEFNDKNHGNTKLTLMAFVVKAVSSMLREYKAFNASIDSSSMEIIYKHFYNIGFAADTPKGLMVPVIKDADQKNVVELAQNIQMLAQKAREGSITLPEISNGTFTITNVGNIGGTGLVPIINYPESAILGMGRVIQKPVVRDDAIVARRILPVTLCFDHRVADGVQAAHFVNQLKQMLEDPFVFMTGI